MRSEPEVLWRGVFLLSEPRRKVSFYSEQDKQRERAAGESLTIPESYLPLNMNISILEYSTRVCSTIGSERCRNLQT